MIDVDHQDEVDRGLGELGVELGGADGLDVRDPGLAGVPLEHPEHFGLQVAGQDRSLGADSLCHANAVVAGAGTDVRHGCALGDLEGVEHGLGLFFLDPRLTKEPVDAFPRHDVGDLPAHVKPGRVAPRGRLLGAAALALAFGFDFALSGSCRGFLLGAGLRLPACDQRAAVPTGQEAMLRARARSDGQDARARGSVRRRG